VKRGGGWNVAIRERLWSSFRSAERQNERSHWATGFRCVADLLTSGDSGAIPFPSPDDLRSFWATLNLFPEDRGDKRRSA
jgi:hypothetical protein